ncbi:MAG: 3-deoxy-D-manno-octulosonic acid transferase [Paludibacter sp.]|nr:3-deoxy-D-manno-octulosonic acid transferase [Paludibacter sp.]
MWWLDIVVKLGVLGTKVAALWSKKAKLWIDGRNGLLDKMAAVIRPEDHVVWFHAASLGEFEEGRPVIEKIRAQYPHYKILVTFFSPSGYEIRKNYSHADWVFYLPADTSANMKRFLDIVHPEIAVFIKYEFWLNMLLEIKKRSIRTFVISARFIPNSRFFSWYGGIFRNSLKAFETIFVQDKRSVELLESIGFVNAVLAGDPRFDRVDDIAQTDWKNEIVERFKNGQKVFIGGSTCGAADEDLLQVLINNHPNTKFLIVPHEMDVEPMEKIEMNTKGGAIRYSKCTAETDFANFQVLIVDTIGMLALLYRYGNWAFIGGGFIAGIHSVIEATIYGMPAVFGPNYQKNRPGIDMIELGACKSIQNAEELDAWFTPLENDDEALTNVSNIAFQYCQQNKGASNIILKKIFE